MLIRKVSDKIYYVGDEGKPYKVIIRGTGEVKTAGCMCQVYKRMRDCAHSEAVRKKVKTVKFARPVKVKTNAVEYIGGNKSKEITAFLKRIKY